MTRGENAHEMTELAALTGTAVMYTFVTASSALNSRTVFNGIKDRAG